MACSHMGKWTSNAICAPPRMLAVRISTLNVRSRKNVIGMRRCFARFSTAGNTMTETTKSARSRMVAQAGMPRSDALQGGQQANADEGDEKTP